MNTENKNTILVTRSRGDCLVLRKIVITGGHTTVCGPSTGDTATLDYDSSATIEGGVFIGTGASGMAQSFSLSDQGVIGVQVGSQEAGTEVVVRDLDGNVVLSHTPELAYSVFIYSSKELISGETYLLEVGDVSGEIEAQ